MGAVDPPTPLLGALSLCPGRSARPASVGFHRTLKSKSRAYPQVLFPFNLGFIIYVCVELGEDTGVNLVGIVGRGRLHTDL